MIGDGGQSGFDAAMPELPLPHVLRRVTGRELLRRRHRRLDLDRRSDLRHRRHAVLRRRSSPTRWCQRTMFAGTADVLRTKTHGLGTMTLAEFAAALQRRGPATSPSQCGDWASTRRHRRLTAATACGDRARSAQSPRSSGRAGTRRQRGPRRPLGRVLISKNVDADPAGTVTWTRLDSLAANDPNRFVSRASTSTRRTANHAWVSYTGFNASTPALPGHVFEVTYNPGAGTATWVDRSYNLGDLPINDVVLDPVTGDVYASSDFGVHVLAAGTTTWASAAPGMPNVACRTSRSRA